MDRNTTVRLKYVSFILLFIGAAVACVMAWVVRNLSRCTTRLGEGRVQNMALSFAVFNSLVLMVAVLVVALRLASKDAEAEMGTGTWSLLLLVGLAAGITGLLWYMWVAVKRCRNAFKGETRKCHPRAVKDISAILAALAAAQVILVLVAVAANVNLPAVARGEMEELTKPVAQATNPPAADSPLVEPPVASETPASALWD